MTLPTKVSLVITGVSLGVVVAFAADMLFFQGDFMARSLKHHQPTCGQGCHG